MSGGLLGPEGDTKLYIVKMGPIFILAHSLDIFVRHYSRDWV